MKMMPHHLALQVPNDLKTYETEDTLEIQFTPQLRTVIQNEFGASWLYWNPSPRPCFNPQLLNEIKVYQELILKSEGRLATAANEFHFDYVVHCSDTPNIYNLGGDLNLFHSLIEKGEGEELLRYGVLCLELAYQTYHNFHLPLTTIGLIQGDCLGGGFEAALANEVIIAEKKSRFAFPEILFNLFPGMGAYSFLDRKVGQKLAEELITSGKRYTAEELHALGIIDIIAEDGEGKAAVEAFIRSRKNSSNGLHGISSTRHRVHPLDFSELEDIVKIWVDTALRLTPRDLRLINKLVNKQDRLHE